MRMAYLPGELMNEILLRLPVKSLARFRCVSKQWQSLINDSEFATLHLNRSKKKKKQTRPHSLVISTQDDTSILYTVARVDYPNSPSFKKFFLSNYHEFQLHGLASCDGLLCFWAVVSGGEGNRDLDIPVYLINPVTGEEKKLPPLPPLPMKSYFSRWVGLGFGAASRDYKVIVKAVYCSGNRQTIHVNVSVYSLNSNNWTTLEDIQLPEYNYGVTHLTHSSAIVINGVAHWIMRSGRLDSFDLVHEVRRELPSLPVVREYLDLYEMGGTQLSALCYKHIFTKIEIWVMKEIGVREPWIQTGIIGGYFLDIWRRGLGGSHWSYKTVIGQWNDDEILLQVNRKLVLYNTKNNTRSNLEIDGLPTTDFKTAALTESLFKLVH